MSTQTASVVSLEEFRRKRQVRASGAASPSLPSQGWIPAMCCWVWVMVYPA